MARTTYDRYLETQVLSADPVQLVNLLYRGAIEAVVAARCHLAAGAIGERSGRIVKAWEILNELSTSLEHKQAPELCARLAELYAHMQRRLMDANIHQSDAPLAEVEALLTTLSEAWSEVKSPAPPVNEHEYVRLSRAI